MNTLLKTSPIKHMVAVRIFAGGPLAFFGLMHITNQMPMAPLLEAAGLPTIMAIPAALAEFVAGVMLLAGAVTRLGGVIAIGTMLGAVVTHIKIPSDGWPLENGGPQEPPLMFVAIAVILFSAYLIFRGGGKWSVDAALTAKASSSQA